MKPLSLIAALLLIGCAGTGDKWRATSSFAARKLGPILAKVVITSAVQSLTGDEQASFLDSAAAGLRTAAGDLTSSDVQELVTIWTAPAPEMRAVASKAAELKAATGAKPEVLASALNDAAAIVRANAATP